MKYILIAFFIIIVFSVQAQKRDNNTKRSVKYQKLSFEDKESFLLDKIKRAKESRDFESLEEWNLELKQLKDNHFYSADQMLKNGFFVDVLFGLGFYSSNFSGNNFLPFIGFGPSVRFGNKWSLTKNEKSGLNPAYY